MSNLRLSAAAVLSLAIAEPAQADIEICNHNSVGMDFAIASWVERPYLTNQVQGWFAIRPGTCRSVWTGDYAATTVYIHAVYQDGIEWRENGAFTWVCVRSDGEAFVRRGRWGELQNCPRGWDRRRFYSTQIDGMYQRVSYRGR